MSKVFNMVGGGGKNISSIVITGLESTDTVTCTKDGKSYTTTWDDTAQHWEIVGLPLGTFTITATNGTKTSMETVLIDVTGVYEVEMSFKLWLYNGSDGGNEFTDITGGWIFDKTEVGSGSPTTEKRSDSIYEKILSTGNPCAIAVRTSNLIDVSSYSKIFFELEAAHTDSYAEDMIFLANDESIYAVKLYSIPANSSISRTTLEFDISSINGMYFPRVAATTRQSKVSEVTLYKCWLE